MAKYYVKHACGHEVQVDLFGKTADRENKIEWLETTLCPECYAREQAQLQNKDNQIEEVEMHYAEYKNNFSNCQTLPNSYDSKTKTIVVLVPVEKEAEAVAEATEEEALTVEGIAETCNAPASAIEKMTEMPNEKLDEMLSQYNKTMASPNPKKLSMVDQAKKSVELVKLYKKQNNL